MKLNQRARSVVGSTTLAITVRAKELKAQGFDVVNFAGGEPDFDTPEFIKDAARAALQSGFTKYTPSVGTLELRQAVARKFKAENNLEYKPSQVVISCGAKHCLYNIIQALADVGEEVIIPAPYWVSYPEMVKLSGAAPVFLNTRASENFKVTPHLLEKVITKKTKAFILNSPSNPTGVVYTRQELAALAAVCVEYGVYVISDEIYEKLIYDTDEYVSIASLGREIYDLTITVNGVSKAFAMTGWRIGYFAGPQEIVDVVKNLQDHSTSNPTSLSQYAALAALQAPPESIAAMRNEFKERRDLIVSLIDGIDQIRYIYPGGAFYVFCDISAFGIDAMTFAQRVLDEIHVAFIPGDGFGAPGYVRISFATSRERIEEGVKRIRGWVGQLSKQ